ncbi:MAG: hypothetical protein BMS9Abin28_1741 [Anaerolineae bacterium]|nr:MAG: hypothetical protein BMS9Abin28_1741 [Anaerolineae bacterium]
MTAARKWLDAVKSWLHDLRVRWFDAEGTPRQWFAAENDRLQDLRRHWLGDEGPPRQWLAAVSDRFREYRARWSEADARNRRRLALLALLLLLLLCVSSAGISYLFNQKPLTAILPPAPAVAGALRPHYLFSIYGVQTPVGVAVTPGGDRIYVAENGGDRLIKAFDRDGNFQFSFTSPGTTSLERAPVYIALAPDGRVFVSDRRQRAIHIFDAGGNYIADFPPPGRNASWSPLGIGFRGDDFFVTEVAKHQAYVFDGGGALKMMLGGEGKNPGQFWFPNGIAEDDQGSIYIADGNNGRLQVFDEQGRLQTVQTAMSLPRGIWIDNENRLYVVDAVGQTIHTYGLYSDELRYLFSFGDMGFGDGEFNFPNDIAVDETGRIYIADRENHRVQVWSY